MGFNLVDDKWDILEMHLSFVELENVTFIIDLERKEQGDKQGIRTVHAAAKGTLVMRLPHSMKLTQSKSSEIETLPLLRYSPRDNSGFHLDNVRGSLQYVERLYAYNNQVKVKV